ncbi:MAG: uroporphyrinogen-III synthase [Rubrivivax sp.]|nr:uroporphyrinogen-III synthase [Rubrivivax sp.]
MQVIVTRPQAQALPWVDALRAHGYEAHALPLIDIEPARDPKPLRMAWRQLSQYVLVMFVSANAVQHFFAQQPEDVDWPLSSLAASTGPGTTAALQQAGLRGAMIVEPLHGAGYDSEALWARLSNRHWAGSRVLIVRGEEGREWLSDQFRAAGAEVTALTAYRRLAPNHNPATKALLAGAVAEPSRFCWFFSSSEAVGHLVELVPTADWSRSRALVSHLRIAQAARSAGFGDVHLVDPQPLSVVETIRQIQHLPRLA